MVEDALFQQVLEAEIAYIQCRERYVPEGGEEAAHAHCQELGNKFDELLHEWEQRENADADD